MLDNINDRVFLSINHFANNSVWFDSVAFIIAEYLPFAFIATLVYLWFRNVHNTRHYVLFAGYASLVGLSLSFIITLLYFHPRPFMDGLGTTLIQHAPETSFPSDHTTFMLSIAFAFLFIKATRKLGAALVVIGIVGGLFRVLSGIHYPFDILGSLIVSICAGLLIIGARHNFDSVNQFIINLYCRFFSCQFYTAEGRTHRVGPNIPILDAR